MYYNESNKAKEEMKMKKVQFEVEAKKYFEIDPDRLEEVWDDDMVLVTIDFERERAEFTCYINGDSPSNFPAEEDDFDAVVKLWEELGMPGIDV